MNNTGIKCNKCGWFVCINDKGQSECGCAFIKEEDISTFPQYEIKRLGSKPRGLFRRFGDK